MPSKYETARIALWERIHAAASANHAAFRPGTAGSSCTPVSATISGFPRGAAQA